MGATETVKLLGRDQGKVGFLASIGVRFMIDGDRSGGGFSLVEHPMPAHALAAPLHRHSREDEYSVVLEGRVGALLGDDVVYAGPGDLIFKPRGEWHTFWNAGEEPARLLEIISPAGFERYFEELTELPPDLDRQERVKTIAAIAERYGLEMDFASVPDLLEQYNLVFGSPSQ